MNAQIAIAIAVGVAAVVEDLLRRRISNWISLAALAGGLGWQVSQQGWMGLATALGGCATGFGVFLVFYLLGGMGGGDVKLMAGFGALLGAGRLIEAALWTAGLGGLMAAVVIGVGALRRRSRKQPDVPQQAGESIPYAPAIALGVWLSLVPRG